MNLYIDTRLLYVYRYGHNIRVRRAHSLRVEDTSRALRIENAYSTLQIILTISIPMRNVDIG